jgi:pimeloyl-ACP methyl ester carboxylesterase
MKHEAEKDRTTQLETLGTGTPLVLIGGSDRGLQAFPYQLPLAEEGYQLIARVPRSELPESVDFEEEASRLNEVLPHQALHVVGHSWGGLTALHLAALRAENIGSLLLIEPAAMSVANDEPSC